MKSKSMVALLFSLMFGIIYYYYISILFENDRHFSHLSQVEREMSFRTEMGFYFNFYKRLTDQNDLMFSNKSLTESMDALLNDNLSEFPYTVNALKKFNIYPELILGLSYRLFNYLLNCLGFEQLKQCFLVDRGQELTPVVSCEGISDHFYFYVNSIFSLNSIVCSLIFLNSYIISGHSLLGSLLSTTMFFYNQIQCSRVQWTPALRESFGYPIYIVLNFYINYCLETDVSQLNSLIVVSLVVGLLICWQFSPFILFTQLICLYLTLKCMQSRQSKNRFLINLFKCHLLGTFLASAVMFFNITLFTSLYFSFIISFLLLEFFSTKLKLNEKLKSDSLKLKILIKSLIGLILLSLTVILKVLISYMTKNRDDSHIWFILLSKLTNYRDFHTLLYICSPEYDFMQWEDIKSISVTLLMPVSIIATLISLIKWPNKPVIQFNAIQTLLFMFMALLIMRLKLLFVPQLCIMCGLLCRWSSVNLKKISLFALVISLSSIHGIGNIHHQLSIIGEYFNEPLEQVIDFTISSTHQNSVFAGTMPTMANLMLSTRRPIVNHPYYESELIRNRTHMIYQLYSSHEIIGVHKDLSSLSIDYIVLEKNYCYSWSGKCRFSDIWKVEDLRLGRNDIKDDMPLVCDRLFADPKPLFRRVFANNYYHVLQLIKSTTLKSSQ